MGAVDAVVGAAVATDQRVLGSRSSLGGIMFRPFRSLFFVALIIPSSSSLLVAQSNTGTISGVVKDSSGGVLPGATVKVVNDGPNKTNSRLDLVANGDGSYRTEPLAVGAYRVAASLDGFETSERRIVLGAGQTATADFTLSPARFSQSVVVTARRVEEAAQDVPIPVSVVKGDLVSDAGAFNVNRLKEMIPTVQFYSTNPRNSAINIRGLGAPFGLTNDGLEQGVGLYIDGVYYSRPASATLDFLDVDQVEVLRGPEGTLFGKNTTAGALNVTTRKPSFSRSTEVEVNYGSLQFVQAKASVTGPLAKSWAGRISFSGTTREGTVYNATTRGDVNNMNNVGVRGQLLYAPSASLAITLAIDDTRQRANGYTQVIAGVAPTLRPANRQWAQIISDLHYTPPTYNAFDRVTDIDSPLRSYQDLGGASLNIDWKVGPGRIASTTAWRYWDWDPASDRDFIGLPITTVSAGTSKQHQWTQEVRYAGDVSHTLNFVAGAFLFNQTVDSDPVITQEQGSAAARFLLAPSANANTPGLLDGYGFSQSLAYENLSAALFGQLQWAIGDRVRLLPGIRLNYDQKKVDFNQQTYGGLQTTNPALIALQQSVLAPQAYKANVGDTNTSGQITAAFKITDRVNAYGTFATGFKSVGLNLNGVPTDSNNRPVLAAAVVKPEDVRNYEVGIKTTPVRGVTANLAVFDTEIKDFQAQVTNGSVGVIRGYLANAEHVRVRGVEFDGNARVGSHLSIYNAIAYTDGRYVTFTGAPPPLEDTGGPQFEDISGSLLPGISRWAISLGGEATRRARLFERSGEYFAALDASYRSSFSSSATYSRYMVVPSYTVLNARVGFRIANGWTLSVWSRNLLNTRYFELLSAAPGNTGLIVGQPGDPRTAGITLRLTLK
jgi:iron complex outermembrane receptor protein